MEGGGGHHRQFYQNFQELHEFEKCLVLKKGDITLSLRQPSPIKQV